MHKFNTKIIDTTQGLEDLYKYVQTSQSPLMVIDVETDSKEEKLANLYGIGVCFDLDNAFYIPWRTNPEELGVLGDYTWDAATRTEIVTKLIEWFKTTNVVGHNIIYDILVLERTLSLEAEMLENYVYADTILMKHTLEEEPPFGLKDVAVEKLGPWADQAQEDLKQEVLDAGGKWLRSQKDMYMASTLTLGKYCCWDVMLTALLFDMFDPMLDAEKLSDFFYEEEVMPLYKFVTINMKRHGFPIDLEYYEQLKQDISNEIIGIEDEIMNDIACDIGAFEDDLLEKQFPVKPTGNFPKIYAEMANIPLPVAPSGKVTMAAGKLKKHMAQYPQHTDFYEWIINKTNMPVGLGKQYNNLTTQEVQSYMYLEKNNTRYIFNLKSNDHLAYLISSWGLAITNTTPSGKPKIDDSYLNSIKNQSPVIEKLINLKKLNKILSTYIEGILDRQLDGFIYTSMLQFGTTSGRYSSRNPNLQNQPRIKDDDAGLDPIVLKYVNAIRAGFIAGQGNKVVNADYSALEPRCFAHMSGDKKLQNVFISGEDLYSRIAIDVFGLQGISAIKSDDNYLGKVQPEFRQKSKIFCLAVVYGAEASRISDAMGVSYAEAAKIISAYLRKYPALRRYMTKCNVEAKTTGMVRTELGRVRHLREAQAIQTLEGDRILDYKYARSQGKEDVRRRFKTSLNNAKNFPIQGLAAHIVNRAMIDLAKKFRDHNIKGWLALQVHDEITAIVAEEHAELASQLMQDAMENTTQITVPLIAEPLIADNWGEAK